MTGFPIENLPYGVTHRGIAVAIEDRVLHLRDVLDRLPAGVRDACASGSLNALMALGRPRWRELRERLTEILRDTTTRLTPMDDVEMLCPVSVGDYTDFYASIFHATNVGALFRPDNPLLPNYKHLPIGYHGRASSIVVSGSPVRRPQGQLKAGVFGASQSLDYELEVGFLIGPGNALGEPVPIERAEEQIFGVCLVNDWSARDIQSWEYQPLGPFLGKSFATSISPWVVTMEALAPFRAPSPEHDPPPLPYLTPPADAAIDLTLEVHLSSRRMREEKIPPMRLSRGNLRDLYWTPAQFVAHHTSNGCNLRPGDLLASGTVSGPTRDALGCLLEITRRGAEPLTLPTGETRRFLEDGDEVTMRGWCEREGHTRIGLGSCTGRITSSEAALPPE
jgi:fumarylacetoacetase